MIRIDFKRIAKLCAITLFCALPFQTSFANQYTLPSSGNDLIGDITYTSGTGETVVSIGQRYNVGVNAVSNSNLISTDAAALPASIRVPTQHILPSLPHRGIIINLAEMRMYYFPEGTDTVMTFPVGIGRVGKTVPTGDTYIARKVVNPSWTPPDDIREFDKTQGIELPKVMGPGPDNPLGPYALYLRVPTYLIHSTIFPESIGRRASFGCIRMNESDIKQFFPIVRPGTKVAIVDLPTKVGWQGNTLYLETHPPLEEHINGGMKEIVDAVKRSTAGKGVTLVDWQTVSYLETDRDGVPHEIGFRAQ